MRQLHVLEPHSSRRTPLPGIHRHLGRANPHRPRFGLVSGTAGDRPGRLASSPADGRVEGLSPARRPGERRKGSGVLRELLRERNGLDQLPESPLETRFLDFVHGFGLSMPQVQKRFTTKGGRVRRVDVFFPQARLVIELDSYKWHSGRRAWEEDLMRRNELAGSGPQGNALHSEGSRQATAGDGERDQVPVAVFLGGRVCDRYHK
jgi:hypothetical protein